MHPNNPVRIAIKYLTFIAPVVVVFLSAYFLFHNAIFAGTITIIIVVIGLIALSYYISKSGKFDRAIQAKLTRYKK
jgi:positive regulator of sigma E activity